jgi:hypothetical protein
MTSIPINLTEDYQQKLQYIQEVTQQDFQASLLAAINAYYHQLKQIEDPLARLKQSKLVGSFQGDPNLSEQSEEIFRSFKEDL